MTLLLERLARQVRDGHDRLAIWSRGENRQATFGQLAERVAAWSTVLAAAVAEPLLPCGLALGNGMAFGELFLALRLLGTPVVLLDGSLPLATKLDLCRRLGVRRFLHRDGGELASVENQAIEHAAIAAGAVSKGGEGGEPFLEATHQSFAHGVLLTTLDVAEPTLPPAGTALVKLTSGSTGTPVGACLSEESLGRGIEQIVAGMEIVRDDRVLLTIPLSHSYGFDNGLLSMVAHGTPLILEPSFFPAAILRALRESDATFLPLVPPLVHSLAQVEWPGELALRRVICAGGVLLPEVARRFNEAASGPVHNFFGSTETGGITFERDPLAREAAGTVGFPLPGVTIELDGDGRVTVHSAANALGRFGEPVAGEPGPRPIQTGDTAVFTPEGRLRLTGRSADILNIGGKKVAALEVEAALGRLPGVQQAAVIGVADPARGDRAVAFLVADRWPLQLGALPAHLAPRELRRLDALPITERGKVDREALRRLAATKP
jgi:acyl-coenzyme A synthetase/AMP-(fatty) acid ligase